MATLFVNACLRGEDSRTLQLCREYLADMPNVEEVDLAALKLQPLYAEDVKLRTRLQNDGNFGDSIFDLARQFAAADEIVVGAPYWDLSFPSALKVYFEHISVCDVCFAYSPDGQPSGLCRARRAVYITTCGGSIAVANDGFDYVSDLFNKLFCIPQTACVAAELLDVVGTDVGAQMDKARKQIALLKQQH